KKLKSTKYLIFIPIVLVIIIIVLIAGCANEEMPAHAPLEKNQPPVRPFSPIPHNAESGLDTTFTLSWTGGDPDSFQKVTYKICLDTVNPPDSIIADTQSWNNFTLSGLLFGKTYYWTIEARDQGDSTSIGGPWHFSIRNQPGTPIGPFPGTNAKGLSIHVTLTWIPAQLNILDSLKLDHLQISSWRDSLYFKVYIDTLSPGDMADSLAADSLHDTTYLESLYTGPIRDTFLTVFDLKPEKVYYWQVITGDSMLSQIIEGPVWKFSVGSNYKPPKGMVLVRTQPFRMGDSLGSGDPNERPLHTVMFKRHFWMDSAEVSNMMYWRYDSTHVSPVGNDSNFPVNGITWKHAVHYCNWRSLEENLELCYDDTMGTYNWICDYDKNGYRLPTESEWEYAARGGLAGKLYPWGNSLISAVNYLDNGTDSSWETGRYSANSFGLFDMAGNVAEWCQDWYDSLWYRNYTPDYLFKAAPGSPIIKNKVVRGGAFNSSADSIRVSKRMFAFQDSSYEWLGFRCVRKME
ncbi:MAG: SUMF1/EgtB/PvdO family nonheme iron enzyme, partial [bacterium]